MCMAEQETTNGAIRNNITIHERIACLETLMQSIVENHLPHLQKRIDSLDSKFYAIITLLVANLVGIIVNFIK